MYFAYKDEQATARTAQLHIFAEWDDMVRFYMAHGQRASVKECRSIQEAQEFLGLPTKLYEDKVCYAVADGRHTGIFPSVEAAWAQVEYLSPAAGTKGPRMIKFKNPTEAKKWMSSQGKKCNVKVYSTDDANGKKTTEQNEQDELLPFGKVDKDDTAFIYTDGSYNRATSVWGYSAILHDGKDETKQLVFSGSGVEYRKMCQSVGEIVGAYRGAVEAVRLGYENIVICHDFDAVKGYTVGNYNNSNMLATWYEAAMKRLSKKANIRFKKVTAHSGNPLNNKADKYARIAAGIEV